MGVATNPYKWICHKFITGRGPPCNTSIESLGECFPCQVSFLKGTVPSWKVIRFILMALLSFFTIPISNEWVLLKHLWKSRCRFDWWLSVTIDLPLKAPMQFKKNIDEGMQGFNRSCSCPLNHSFQPGWQKNAEFQLATNELCKRLSRFAAARSFWQHLQALMQTSDPAKPTVDSMGSALHSNSYGIFVFSLPCPKPRCGGRVWTISGLEKKSLVQKKTGSWLWTWVVLLIV